MREHVYDGIGGPFDRVPDAPDACVICGDVLPENDRGEVVGHQGDGCTCSEACFNESVRRVSKRAADDYAADVEMFAAWHRERGLE